MESSAICGGQTHDLYGDSFYQTSKGGFIKHNITCPVTVCDCWGQSSLSAEIMTHLKGHT